MDVMQQILSLEDEEEKNNQQIQFITTELSKLKKENQQIKKIIKTLEKLQEEQ